VNPGRFTLHGTSGDARRGRLDLAHGAIETPTFMPVGTIATVKGLTPRDLHEVGAQIILANTYHLWLRPGRDTLVAAGGLHRFMAWDRPILTDSGGFQVFSLESQRTVDDDGVTFRSHLDGSVHRFTPENVVAFQEDLGVDVAMMLDECIKLPASPAAVADSVRRTTRWAVRAAAAWRRERTALFAIVQGGVDPDARAASAAALVELDVSGYAIGGLSVGETREEMVRFARFTAARLPVEKPRYLMGVGTVRDLIAGIDCGIDMFDCVYPTRSGRHGRALTRRGEFNLHNAAFVRDFSALDPDCACDVCATYSRAYIAHLFRAKELLGMRLLSYHNVYVLDALMADARAAIEADAWPAFRAAFNDACAPNRRQGEPEANR
jgi:queuine tRNA-ribosyltransferase